MFVPLAEATVDGAVINLAGALVGVGGIALTYAWLHALYRD